jgi:ABC-type antimicrobial peptide transport system permease subunit
MRMREIVGVVGNAKQEALTPESDPIYYFPYKQLSWGIGTIVLRTAVPPRDAESAARAALASLDPQIPMYQVRTGAELSMSAIARPRFQVVLMATFASVALLLTVAGLYGVLSYAVARRRREIGVRIAFGARHTDVLVLVLREALRLLAAGLVLGLVGAGSAGRLLESMAYGVRPGAGIVLAGACCMIVIAGLAAACVPATRAASVNPVDALRSE